MKNPGHAVNVGLQMDRRCMLTIRKSIFLKKFDSNSGKLGLSSGA